MKIIGLIPSRINSKRLFNKALLEIENLPLVVHTYKRAKLSKLLDDLYICTDSEKISKVAKKFKCKVIKTGKNRTGTDRISEAANKLKKKYDLYINIQGDEPLIDPNHIDKVIQWHSKNKNFDVVIPSLKSKDIDTKHIVKIVKSKNKILYFSRAKVPFPFKKKNYFFNKHLSIISFKPSILKKFRTLPDSQLEKIEGIEMMRALENEMNLGTFELKGNSFSVDTSDDYYKAREYMTKDKWKKKY